MQRKQEKELAEINNLYDKYSSKKQNIKLYSYISNRCDEINKITEIDNIKKEISTKTLELDTAKTELEIVRKNIAQYNKDNENAIKELEQCEQNRLYDQAWIFSTEEGIKEFGKKMLEEKRYLGRLNG